MMKKFLKRMMTVILSLVLVLGMLGSNCLLEVKADTDDAASADTITMILRLSMKGYEGEEPPEIGELVVWAYDDWFDRSSYDVIGSDHVTKSVEGTTMTYTCTFENRNYWSAEWRCIVDNPLLEYNNYFVVIGAAISTGARRFLVELSIGPFRFMDGSNVYYEQYCVSNKHVYKFEEPKKNNHVFLGWKVGEEGNEALSWEELQQDRIFEPTTYYAVWKHPAEDTWAWNNDNGSHWRECNCGELKTAAEAHEWDDGVITRQPTATAEGETTYTCTDCGKTKTEPIPATGKPTVSGNDSISGNNPTLPDNPSTPGNSDIPIDTPGTGSDYVNIGNTADTIHTVNPVNATVNVSTTPTENKEPKTGSVPYIEIYATIAMIAGMAYLLLYFYDDKRGMSEAEKKELMTQLIVWAKKGGYFRRIVALTAIFFLLCYYHSIGKQSQTQWKTT